MSVELNFQGCRNVVEYISSRNYNDVDHMIANSLHIAVITDSVLYKVTHLYIGIFCIYISSHILSNYYKNQKISLQPSKTYKLRNARDTAFKNGILVLPLLLINLN